jgi:putative membrane protein
MMPPWEYMPWYGIIFGPIIMIAVLVTIIVAAVMILRSLGGKSTGTAVLPATDKTALDILKERFARGEIDTDEFEERKRLLSD